MRRAATIAIAALVMSSPASAQSPPPEALLGNSVIVSWVEDRVHKTEKMQDFRPSRLTQTRAIYISTKGQVFIRTSVAGRTGKTSAESVGAAGKTPAGTGREVTFDGSSMTVTVALVAGAARRFVVMFADGFKSCTAQAVAAKEAGAGIIKSRDMRTGGVILIKSITVSGAKCSVREGNIFAD
jgi:hypothetical protein